MASLGIRCGGGGNYNPLCGKLDRNPLKKNSLMMCSSSSNKKPNKGRISISISESNMVRQKQERSQSIAHERLDEWMKQSVVEIVKNLREAPLLVHVYSKDKETSLRTEKAVVEEDWPVVVRKWEKKEAEKPEGVIFVEKLEEEEEEEEEVVVQEKDKEEGVVDGLTRAWGVVVQGRGMGCGPACYLLKTSRVGPACYFCLVRVKSFRMSARQQLQDCWLLN